MEIRKPKYDAEKLTDSDLEQVFRLPPGVPHEFTRSTLLIGARGVGKTTLLKYLEHQGSSSLYISLLEELGTVVKDNLLPGATTHEDRLRQHKERTQVELLVSVSVLRVAAEKGLTLNLDSMRSLLPVVLSHVESAEPSGWLRSVRMELHKPWSGSQASDDAKGTLGKVLAAVSQLATMAGSTLTVLFDRADMIPASAARPIVELLDQHGRFVSVVATRPAAHSDPDWGVIPGVVPGDHYDILHLGVEPRSPEWTAFVQACVKAQLGDALVQRRVPQHVLDSIAYFCRDSVRIALELTFDTLQLPGDWDDALQSALKRSRSALLDRADAALKRWHPSTRRLIESWRERLLPAKGVLSLRQVLELAVKRPVRQATLDLREAPRAVDSFIASALSVGALCPPSSEGWLPGKRMSAVEVQPLLLWQLPDPISPPTTREPMRFEMAPSEFMGSGKPPRRGRAIFVGYRFGNPESGAFFERLSSAIAQHPLLNQVRVVDGHLPAGAQWASKIRERIRTASLGFVGDVTGVRGDVVFELGLAYGLRRAVIPVVIDDEARSRCPLWLTSFQVGTYTTQGGLQGIVTSIHEHVSSPGEYRPRLPALVPSEVAWLCSHPWARHAEERARTVTEAEGLRFRSLEPLTGNNYEEAINLAARAMCLILTCDGTALVDSFSHFASGMAVARVTKLGGLERLRRHVIVYQSGESVDIPDSIRRCQATITVVSDDAALIGSLKRFLGEYRSWVSSRPR
jgi:hypothetical protein